MTDVCLILEGTYPYVAGGVSSWVNDLIQKLDDTTFSIVYIGAHGAKEKKMNYVLPDNVLSFSQVSLYDFSVNRKSFRMKNQKPFACIEEFLERMYDKDTSLFDEYMEVIASGDRTAVDLVDLAYGVEGWRMLENFYNKKFPKVSFIDFFWTWRAVYLPFLSLCRMALPQARVYHSVSTGYAGLVGAIAKHRYQRPLLLTEHGIYTRERKIDIAQADWMYSELADELNVMEKSDFFKDWWLRFFMFLSHLTYERCDEIITLYEGNRLTQIEEGALPHKTRVIPNGVNPNDYLVNVRKNPYGPFKIGFVGRVVPIKDVKTFISACQIVTQEVKNVDFYVMGPTDEDENYYRECLQMTKMKSLEKTLHFTGKVKMNDYYPDLDLIVLTSISEAQPLVVLEAAACGIPMVATDVGACREMICGRPGEDSRLGPGGMITPICNAQETANAIIRILKNPALRRQMGTSGRKRVEMYYQQKDFIANYQEIYQRFMEAAHCVPEGLSLPLDNITASSTKSGHANEEVSVWPG